MASKRYSLPPRLHPEEREWLEDLAQAIYEDVFVLLDAEEGVSGRLAGRLATLAEKAVVAELHRLLVSREGLA